MEVFIAKDQQFVADWIVCQGLGKLVEVFSILCISSLLIKAQLSLNIARSIGNDQRESTYAFFLRRDRRFILLHIIKIFTTDDVTTDFYNVKIFVY